jgi:hypothetical protein
LTNRPIPMIDAGSILRELAGDGFEALIIDAPVALTHRSCARLLHRAEQLHVTLDHTPSFPFVDVEGPDVAL